MVVHVVLLVHCSTVVLWCCARFNARVLRLCVITIRFRYFIHFLERCVLACAAHTTQRSSCELTRFGIKVPFRIGNAIRYVLRISYLVN